MNEKDENNSLNEGGKNPFSLPEGYFDSFAHKMMRKIEIAEELKEFKLLSSIDKKLPFVTPGNYFSENHASLEIKAELSSYEKLSAVSRINVFEVPPSYFDTSAEKIKNGIEVSGELSAYPALQAIEKHNGFTVPQAYFEASAREISGRLAGENKTGTVLRIIFSRKTMYAAAAVLVLAAGIYYFALQRNETMITPPCEGLACLDKSDVKEQQLINMDDESLMEIVNPETLSKNLQKELKGEEKKDDKEQKEDFVIENTDVNDIVDEI